MKKVELHVHFFGRVQGVGFRSFVQKAASAASFSGYVQNLENGSVFICAVGEKEKLTEFLEKIRAHFLIEREEISYQTAKKDFQGFQILH